MAKNKSPQCYFVSDFHMSHSSTWTDDNGKEHQSGIIHFERHQFNTIQEHDDYIADLVRAWGQSWAPGSTLYYLGDFGNIEYLWLFNILRLAYGHKVVFLYGNHDKQEDYDTIAAHVDEIYKYPIYLSDKLVISHEPVAVWPSQINVHGHLHGAVLNSNNYLNASLHVSGYKPVSTKQINSRFSMLPKHNYRFLYEPWCKDGLYKITQKRDDLIVDKDGVVDVSASRVLQRLDTIKRAEEKNPYQPYNGTLGK